MILCLFKVPKHILGQSSETTPRMDNIDVEARPSLFHHPARFLRLVIRLIQSHSDLSIFTPGGDVYVYGGGAYVGDGVDDGARDGLSLPCPAPPTQTARFEFHFQPRPGLHHHHTVVLHVRFRHAPHCCSTNSAWKCRTKTPRYIRFRCCGRTVMEGTQNTRHVVKHCRATDASKHNPQWACPHYKGGLT